MLKTLVFAATQLIGKPHYAVPTLAGILANFIVLFIGIDSYFSFFYEALVFGEVPDASLLELPFYLFTTYSFDLLVMGLTVFLATAIGFYLIYVYSALLAARQPLIRAMTGALGKLPEILGLAAFLMVVLLLYGAILYAALALGFAFGALSILSTISLIALILAGIIAYARLAFTPVIMAVERQKLKAALGRSWQWSAKKTIPILVFLLVLSAITGAANTFFSLLGEATDIEALAVLVLLLGIAVSNSYYNIAYIKYFLDSKEKE